MKRILNIFSLAMLFSLLLSLVGLSPIPARAAAAWQDVGPAGFSPGEAKYISFAIYNGTPYVAYRDGENEFKASVKKFNGTDWVNVGLEGFSVGVAYDISLAIDNGTPYVAYSNADNAFFIANVMKFNGTDWVSVGPVDFSDNHARHLSLAFHNGTPYLAYDGVINGSFGMLNVLKFDGANWVNVGPEGFVGASLPSLVFNDDTPYVVFGDSPIGEATVMKFNGTDWVYVGSPGFSPGLAYYPSLAFDGGIPYVAFGDGNNFGKASVMKFNGVNWVDVGPANFSEGEAYYTSLAFEGGTPYLAYRDVASGNRATVMKFNGTDWVNVGSAGFSTGEASYVSLVFNSSIPYVAFQDVANSGKAGVMKFVDESSPPVSFEDVDTEYWAKSFIDRLYAAGITGGCNVNPLQYCPETTVTRDQMAVFLLRGIHGSSYNPPSVGGSTGFSDVPTSHWAAGWIKQLAAEGITGGCGGGNFCPGSPVTRDQMAVFLLKAKHGTSYSPPGVGGSTGFTDVPTTYWAAAWIKQLAAEGITGGCGSGIYCPGTPVNRAQMAVFLVRTFNLP